VSEGGGGVGSRSRVRDGKAWWKGGSPYKHQACKMCPSGRILHVGWREETAKHKLHAYPGMAFVFSRGGVHAVKIYKRLVNILKKRKKKLGVPHTPSPFAFSLVSSLPDVVKMKGNATRGKPLLIASKQKETRRGGASPSQSHSKRKEIRRGGASPLPAAFKTKGNTTRRGFTLPAAFETEGNATRRKKLLLVAFKTKGNATRGEPLLIMFKTKGKATRGASPSSSCPKREETQRGGASPSPSRSKRKETRRGGASPSSSRSKQKETQRGGGKPLLVAFVVFVGSMGLRRGKWGGLRSRQQLLGGQILKENFKKRHTLYARCSFPAPSLPLPFSTLHHSGCCRPPFVFGGAAGGWSREGGSR